MLHHRVRKLEDAALLQPCAGCGGIDWRTGTGVLGCAMILMQEDGEYLCACKGCGRSFRAALMGEDGVVRVSGAREAAFPV